METHVKDLSTIVGEAVEIASAAERQAYLERACAGDVELRHNVDRLLDNLERAGDFLECPVAVAPGPEPAVSEHPGVIIGPYKLLEQIGEGGFGVVFMAEQTQPVRRKVALKILKPGMDTRQVIARFEAERQALALMEHPNIARVLEAGATESGRPYFVMELVKGIPITEYCDQFRLPTRERLELFIDVCRAVQHAHQKGIIHRDLKPANVMVTEQDGKPLIKVIDFGIAKATGPQLTDKTLFTGYAQLLGTPQYMSPEQVSLSAVDVDTRSDVYSLGVLLYELLTGTTPFEKEKLTLAGFDELRRIIREEEPPTPSIRMSTLQENVLTTTASRRQIDPQRLRHQLRGELDWIVMKALEKDRNRRYESASTLARDVERHLNDEPVHACPPSTVYRFQKFAQRNKGILTTLCLVGLALIGGAAASIWQAVEASRARITADERLVLSNDLLVKEQQARRVADDERQRADLERKRADDELIRADSERDRAEGNFQKALDAVDRMLFRVGDDTLRNIPQMEQVQNHVLHDAVAFYEKLREDRPNDAKLAIATAEAYMRLVAIQSGEEGKKSLQIAHDLFRKIHADFPDDRRVRIGLAYTYVVLGRNNGDPVFAEKCFRQSNDLLLRITNNGSDLGRSYQCLADALVQQSRFDEAEQTFKKALEIDPENGQIYSTFARFLERVGRVSDAISLMQQAVEVGKKRIVVGSKWATNSRSAYGEACRALGEMLVRAQRTQEALPHFLQAIDAHKQLTLDFPSIGRNRDNLFSSILVLARAYHQLGYDGEALNQLEQLNPSTGNQYLVRGKLNATLQKWDKARADFERTVELESVNANAHNQIAWFLVTCPGSQSRDLERAASLAERGCQLAPADMAVRNTLGVCLYRLGDWNAAIAALQKAVDLAKEEHGYNSIFLAMAHWQLGDKEKSRMFYEQTVQWIEKNSPQDEELGRFRDEAAELLGVKTIPK